MKLQISFDLTNLDKALSIAKEVAPYADILEIGTLLVFVHGIKALESFRAAFPNKKILVDAKIVDRAKETVSAFTKAGADWVTVLAGTTNNTIHSAGATAREKNAKIMLDLIDAKSLGQSALEAQSLDVDALLLHKPYEEESALVFLDQWDMLRGNTKLPIFVAGKITREIFDKIVPIKPDGVVIGTTITDAANPAEEAAYFANRAKELEARGGIPESDSRKDAD